MRTQQEMVLLIRELEVLKTDSFSIKRQRREVVLLINILIIKFDLDCSLHMQRGNPVLYNKSKSLKKNMHKLLPHMHDSVKYKILGNKYK